MVASLRVDLDDEVVAAVGLEEEDLKQSFNNLINNKVLSDFYHFKKALALDQRGL